MKLFLLGALAGAALVTIVVVIIYFKFAYDVWRDS
jgi:hypothetical protein